MTSLPTIALLTAMAMAAPPPGGQPEPWTSKIEAANKA